MIACIKLSVVDLPLPLGSSTVTNLSNTTWFTVSPALTTCVYDCSTSLSCLHRHLVPNKEEHIFIIRYSTDVGWKEPNLATSWRVSLWWPFQYELSCSFGKVWFALYGFSICATIPFSQAVHCSTEFWACTVSSKPTSSCNMLWHCHTDYIYSCNLQKSTQLRKTSIWCRCEEFRMTARGIWVRWFSKYEFCAQVSTADV